jgi:cytochrome c oxidase subunit IV
MNHERSMAGKEGAADEENLHALSYGQLLAVLGTLLMLTGISITVSRFDLGVLTVWVALLIASIKATLVLLYFMHLRYEGKAFVIAFLVTVFVLAAFVGLVFWDVAYRAGAGG